MTEGGMIGSSGYIAGRFREQTLASGYAPEDAFAKKASASCVRKRKSRRSVQQHKASNYYNNKALAPR